MHLSRMTSTSCSECCGRQGKLLVIHINMYMYTLLCLHVYLHVHVGHAYPFYSLLKHLINKEREVLWRAVIQVHKMLKILQHENNQKISRKLSHYTYMYMYTHCIFENYHNLTWYLLQCTSVHVIMCTRLSLTEAMAFLKSWSPAKDSCRNWLYVSRRSSKAWMKAPALRPGASPFAPSSATKLRPEE